MAQRAVGRHHRREPRSAPAPQNGLRRRHARACWPAITINLTYTDTAQRHASGHDRAGRRSGGAAARRHARRPTRTTRWSASTSPAGLASVAAQLNALLRPGTAILQSVRHDAAGAGRRRRRHAPWTPSRPPRRRPRSPAAAPSCRCSPTDRRRLPARSRGRARRPTGFAGRIAVNPALHRRSDQARTLFDPTTAIGDPTPPEFHLDQLTSAASTFSPETGLGTAATPYSGNAARSSCGR